MADETVLIAETSSAAETPTSLESLSSEELASWRMTGKFPEAPAKPADTPPASEEVSTETPPANEPATPAEPKEPVAAPKTAAEKRNEDRFQELTRHNRELKAKLDAAEAKLKEAPAEPVKVEKPAEATTAAAKEGELKAPVEPVEPDENDPKYPSWDEYQKAMREFRKAERQYNRELVAYETKKAIQEAEQKRAERDKGEEVAKSWNKRVEEFKVKHPDFNDKAKNLPFPKDVAANQAFATFILDPENDGPSLLYHLGDNLEEAERIAGLGQIAVIRELTRLEDSLKKPPAAPGPKRVPSAPAPPTEVGSRSTTQVDDVEEALSSGNQKAYQDRMNAREIAKRSGK